MSTGDVGWKWPRAAEIVEVGPRDGLQSLATVYPTKTKMDLIGRLVDAGLRRIEATSFVRPDVVPQLADAESLMSGLAGYDGVVFRALVGNVRGAERALAAGVREIVALTTASETYNQLNQGMSIAESCRSVEQIARLSRGADTHVVGAIALAWFCPYEGVTGWARVSEIVRRMVDGGVDEIYLATSAGVDGPRDVEELCRKLIERWPLVKWGIHLHNANGMALANAVAALMSGVRVFEGSICGLGGGIRLPEGAQDKGNVATEDLAQLFKEVGVDTGVDADLVTACSLAVGDLLGVVPRSFAAAGGTKAALQEAALRAGSVSGE